MRTTRVFGLALAAQVAACSYYPNTVVRRVDGREVEGRFVSNQSYALYARGALFEAEGRLEAAAEHYALALESDPESPELHTRIGSLRCRMQKGDAEQAFARAERLDDGYEPLWHERALCARSRGLVRDALSHALVAAELDPDRVATTLLVAKLYAELNHEEEAFRWLDALAVRSPRSVAAHRAMLNLAVRHDDRARALSASLALQALAGDALALDGAGKPPTAGAAIDAALLRDDAERAAALSLALGLPPTHVPLRALALGRPLLSLREARRLLDADPGNADAWVAALVALDLLRDEATFAALLAELPVEPGKLGAEAAAELEALLARRIGRAAKDAFRAARSEALR
jgi:tetratricopeptide (TPR) repeat protein